MFEGLIWFKAHIEVLDGNTAAQKQNPDRQLYEAVAPVTINPQKDTHLLERPLERGSQLQDESSIRNASSMPAQDLMLNWLNECTTQHKLCGQYSSTIMPTRVLEMVGTEKIYLRQAEARPIDRKEIVALIVTRRGTITPATSH
ncbi:MAG: hypothetical protein Q9227_004752 [Pyrenula ochraceoflavens]